jgi:ribosomal protein S27AE
MSDWEATKRLVEAQMEGMCQHPNADYPEFDAEAARTMTSVEVKRRFPRKRVTCPDCGETFVAYASFEHYTAGDW